MGLDHSEALVRVGFDGLIAFCFNADKTLSEAGFVENGDHHRRITITEIKPSGHTEEVPLTTENYEINPKEDLQIIALNPKPSATPIYEYNGAELFDRPKNLGDPEDFRWIIDLEGNEFHKGKLNPKRDGYKSKLFLTHGVFYTLTKTFEFYGKKVTKGMGRGNPPNFLGKLAHNVGIDIVCDKVNGSVIFKNNRSQNQLALPRELGCRYEIAIENSCDEHDQTHTSDFPLLYRAVSDPKGLEFDLVTAVPQGHAWATAEAFTDNRSFFLDGEPEVCNQSYLSQTKTLSS